MSSFPITVNDVRLPVGNCTCNRVWILWELDHHQFSGQSKGDKEKMGHILAVNAGSSSLKLSLFSDALELVQKDSQSVSSSDTRDKAFHDFCNRYGEEMRDVEFVVHRVVHGKDNKQPILITKESLHHLQALNDLAPLHNAAALSLVEIAVHQLPHVKNYVMFDTIFHRTIPEHIYTYPIDAQIARDNGLRKYGFHGISYSSILRSVADFYSRPRQELNLIVCHLGSGASVCCIRQGMSLDTSMGFTPLEGLFGGSRSGSIDPALIDHYPTKESAELLLNKKAGWTAVAGTGDFSEIAQGRTEEARLVMDMFCDRIANYVAAYYVKLEGHVSALVFSGGIGEASGEVRRRVVEMVECLGFHLGQEKGNSRNVTEIGDRVLICATDEAQEMARIVKKIV